MSHDFEDDFERGSERRSRRNPRLRETGGGADQTGAGRRTSGQDRTGGPVRSEKDTWENRRRPASRDSAGDELDILGDKSARSVRPEGGVRPDAYRGEPDMAGGRLGASGQPRSRQGGPDAAGPRPGGPGQPRRRYSSPDAAEGRQSGQRSGTNRALDDRRGAARQTAASGGGLPPRLEAQIAKKKKRRRMIAMIVAECFALLFIFGYGFVARTMAKIQRPDDFKIEELKTNDIAVDAQEKMKGYWTIAIFGVDSRDSAIRKNTNADVNMICNINLDTGEIKLVSVYRDSYLNIADNGSYNKINQAYFLGGADQAVEALNRNLDLKINDFVTFNWKAVAQAINILGGVDVELSKAEFYYINSFITETVKATGIGSHQLTHAGMNHLDGVQAVAYGRLRLMDTDYARTERQRKIIALAFEKAQKADFQTLYTMIGTVFPNVYTTLWVDDLVNNAKNISKFHLGETTGFPNQRGDANMGKKGAVVVPATLESNVIRLHEFLFGDPNYVPSDTVKNISARISKDTGVYKEGQVVDKVGTGGGVIQPPKTKAAETEATKQSEDDKGYQTIYETNEDGKKVKRKVKLETDEDGDYIEIETDEDGFRVEDTTKSTVPTRPTTVVETDVYGNPIETESHSVRPGDPTETSPIRPTDADGLRPTRPGETLEHNGTTGYPTTSDRPGTVTEPTSGTGLRPGTVTDPTSGTGLRPGGVTEPTSGSVVDRPGGVTGAPGTSTEPTVSTGPGSSTTPAAEVPQFPGGGSSDTPSQQGPGGQGTVTTVPAPGVSGTVAAPGQ